MKFFWLLIFLPTLLFSDAVPVLSKGRIRPLHIHAEQWLYDTYASETHPSVSSAEEFLWLLTLNGHEAWDDVPLFHLNKKVRQELRLETQYATYNQLTGVIAQVEQPSKDLQRLTLRLTEYQRFGEVNPDPKVPMAQSAYGMNVLPSRQDLGTWLPLNTLALSQYNTTAYSNEVWKQITQIYQELRKSYKPELVESLTVLLASSYKSIEGKPYRVGTHSELRLPSQWQLNAESLYYRYPWIEITLLLYGLAIPLLIFKPRWGVWVFVAAFLVHSWILGLRCFILGRPPVSNMFETIAYVPWIAVLLGWSLWIAKRQRGPLIASGCVAFLLLMLISLTYPRHELENIQAVLNSQYWLIIHVLMVVGSYGAFILSGIIAHYALIKRLWYPPSLETQWILTTLYIGVILLIGGTILGGVWAAQSWGRFWDWDPKESWAFISSCLYLIVIHAYRFGKIRDIGLAIGAIIGLQAITFTWYGVNYILGVGLHSYGFGHGGELFYALFVVGELIFVTTLAILHKKRTIYS